MKRLLRMLALGLLLSLQLHADCVLPASIRIDAPEPCRAWELVATGWQYAQSRMWIHHNMIPWVPAPYLLLDLAAAPPITIVEHPSLFVKCRFVNGEYRCVRLRGAFSPSSYGLLLEYVRDDQIALAHELGHYLWYSWRVQFGDAYRSVQHGTSSDPYVIRSKQAIGALYEGLEQHAYYPQGLLPDSQAEEWCSVEDD